ncbi:hypothetical protein SUGI_0198130 [Cryptomeria japonica]|nr:hypothetical protein SUGI_0198130 [Cryptomeria japonica]
MPMQRKAPWFSPSKLCKRKFIHQRRNAIRQDLNERVAKHEEFQFPTISSRKQKKKKSFKRSGIAIEEERLLIKKQNMMAEILQEYALFIAKIMDEMVADGSLPRRWSHFLAAPTPSRRSVQHVGPAVIY